MNIPMHNLYLGGDGDGFTDGYSELLEFDQESGVWKPFGRENVKMKMTRYSHAMTIVNFNQISMYCT